MKNKVVVLQPPFYRFVGSHNDRPTPSLGYISAILKSAHIEHIAFNADATLTSSYWSFKKLFKNYEYLKQAIDDNSPLYDEVLEQILALNPSHVVMIAGDPLVPTTDTGNPYIGVNFSRRLQQYGIKTIGLSPYYSLNSSEFEKDFNTLLVGEPSTSIIEILSNDLTGIVKSKHMELDVVPDYSSLIPKGQKDDLVFTSLGCHYPCTFCIAGKQYRELDIPTRGIESKTILKDILNRKTKNIYFGDLNFSNYSITALQDLTDELEQYLSDYQITAEMRIDKITQERIDLLKRLNVNTLKIGLEGLNEEFQTGIRKRTKLSRIREVLKLLKENDVNFIFYILLGGENNFELEYENLIKLCHEFPPQNIVTSIWAFKDLDTMKYDSHFSPYALKRWEISKETFFKFLDLQKPSNLTVGKII